LFIDGATDPDVGKDGTPMEDDDFLVLVNAWWQQLTFQVPADVATHQWEIVCDSFDPGRTGNAAANLEVGPRSIVVLRSPAAKTAG
jgi:glycogen operon protein